MSEPDRMQTALPQSTDGIPPGAGWRGGLRRRRVVFFACLLLLTAVDFLAAPRLDDVARRGEGYAHRSSVPSDNDAWADARYGRRRVLFNFRHFGFWWRDGPRHAGWSAADLLRSDGNSVWVNLGGHFGGAVALAMLGMAILPQARLVLAAGTVGNILHEYVVEGMYCDPSFVDLWLNQAGVIVGIGLFLAANPHISHSCRLARFLWRGSGELSARWGRRRRVARKTFFLPFRDVFPAENSDGERGRGGEDPQKAELWSELVETQPKR